MRLERFRIHGLFGLFNHNIEFRLEDRITIIHAPNGYGKTVILKMISEFFGGTLSVFRNYDYEFVELTFDDGNVIRVDQDRADPELFSAEAPVPSEHRNFTVQLTRPGADPLVWNPLSDRDDESLRRVPMSVVEQYIPHLRRIGPGRWRDISSGEVMHYADVMVRYPDMFPSSMRRHTSHPEWLDDIRKKIHCQLIETQRLMVSRKDSRSSSAENSLIPAVKTYSDSLALSIAKALAESATLSQSLDRTFPNRLLSHAGASREPLTEEDLRDKLTDLEQRRTRLSKVSLLSKSEDSALIPGNDFDHATRRILTEYVIDAKKKLDVFDDLLVRIELFTHIINARFQFKTVSVDRDRGFTFSDIKGRPLNPGALSSGEQHELVLVYDLIFKTKVDTLLLIDEPEISLHIAWQKRFLSDLRKIIALSPMDVVLSTHSPQLIGSNLELTVPLHGPENV